MTKGGYEAFKGMKPLAFEEGSADRLKKLPRLRGIPRDEKARVERFGELLKLVELTHLKDGEVPQWPLVWKEMDDGQMHCTGVAFEFGRTTALTKKRVVNRKAVEDAKDDPDLEVAPIEEVRAVVTC